MSHFILITFLVLATAGSALAQREFRLEAGPVHWRGVSGPGYNGFDETEHAQVVPFKVHLTGAPDSFFVTVSSSASENDRPRARHGSESIEYEIYDSTRKRPLKPWQTGAPSEMIQGTFGPGESVKELSFAIVVPPRQIKGAGLYTDLIELTVYKGRPEAPVEQDSMAVAVSILISEITELSFAGTGAGFDRRLNSSPLDFGKLAKGQARDAQFRIRSNAGYRVSVESENRGVLRHASPGVKTVVPYSIEVGGMPVTLSSGAQTPITRKGRLTGKEGDGHAVRVTIGETGGAIAGEYRDIITLTVTSEN